jgi:hypothetical protein
MVTVALLGVPGEYPVPVAKVRVTVSGRPLMGTPSANSAIGSSGGLCNGPRAFEGLVNRYWAALAIKRGVGGAA